MNLTAQKLLDRVIRQTIAACLRPEPERKRSHLRPDVLAAIVAEAGNYSAAAKRLGMKRTTVRDAAVSYRIPNSRFKPSSPALYAARYGRSLRAGKV